VLGATHNLRDFFVAQDFTRIERDKMVKGIFEHTDWDTALTLTCVVFHEKNFVNSRDCVKAVRRVLQRANRELYGTTIAKKHGIQIVCWLQGDISKKQHFHMHCVAKMPINDPAVKRPDLIANHSVFCDWLTNLWSHINIADSSNSLIKPMYGDKMRWVAYASRDYTLNECLQTTNYGMPDKDQAWHFTH
jgi:hypothetical protein